MERASPRAVTWRGRLPFGVVIAALLVATAALGLLWQTGTAEPQVDDLARLALLAHGHGAIAAIAAWWSAFAARGERLAHLVFTVQLTAALLVLLLAWRLVRSVALAAAVALVAVASPFVHDWAQRPLSIAEGLASTALLIAFAWFLDAQAAPRTRAAIVAVAGGVAVLFSGWAALAVLVLAAFDPGVRRAAPAAVVAALALRAGLGFPLDALAGRWSAFGADALVALRLLVWTAVATPAVAFALTRPRVAAWTRDARRDLAVLAAALLLLVTGGLTLSAPAMFFAGEVGLAFACASLAARAVRPQPRVAFIAAAACLVAGGALASVTHPAPSATGSVARDRALVRASGPAFVVVDRGDVRNRARYSPLILAYLAGRPVDVQYADQPPHVVIGSVLEATPNGLLRVDDTLRMIAAVDAARAHLRDDVYADRTRGRIEGPPGATPPAASVNRDFPAPAPGGPVDGFVVQAPYAFAIDGVHVHPGDRLVYLVGKASFVGNAARGTVTIEIPGRAPIAVADDVPPAPAPSTLAWRYRAIPIPVAHDAVVRVRFAASSPSGTNNGDWVAFAHPAIVPAAASR